MSSDQQDAQDFFGDAPPESEQPQSGYIKATFASMPEGHRHKWGLRIKGGNGHVKPGDQVAAVKQGGEVQIKTLGAQVGGVLNEYGDVLFEFEQEERTAGPDIWEPAADGGAERAG